MSAHGPLILRSLGCVLSSGGSSRARIFRTLSGGSRTSVVSRRSFSPYSNKFLAASANLGANRGAMPKRERHTVSTGASKRRGVIAAAADSDAACKLEAVRAQMTNAPKPLDAFIVPTDDPHQSEYVAECFARREFVCGFTGSAGTALVTCDQALLWTDGRYYLQGERELGPGWTLMRAGLPTTPDYPDWLAANMHKGQRVGIDAHTISARAAEELKDTLAEKNIELVCVESNPVDHVWGANRPAMPSAPLRVHHLEYAGVSVEQKLTALRQEMRNKGCSALVVAALDQVAWCLNVRGGDIDFCPVTLSYMLVRLDSATMYVDPAKVTEEVAQHLRDAGVDTKPYCLGQVKQDVAQAIQAGGNVWVDGDYASLAVLEMARACVKEANHAQDARDRSKAKKKKGGRREEAAPAPVPPRAVLNETAPLQLAKAIKCQAELEGMKEAHYRDGAAMATFFHWLEQQIAAGRRVTEVDIGDKLIEVRSQQPGFIEPSFATIAGAGPNGAIIHYRAEPGSCREVDAHTLLLLDSGGQYDCGTTDVTRTQHMGQPTARQSECYTRVLQGNIGIHTTVFPANTPGFMLDSFARRALWRAGLDYRHGTGHGVGAALNVHEGPQSISPRYGNQQSMMIGMVVSNEPGYYEDGSFGIRIENLLIVEEKNTPNRYGGVEFMGFESLTLIPIQKKMIVTELLTQEEVQWIDNYHAKVWEHISPRVDGEVKEWLQTATAPLLVKIVANA